MRNIIKIILLFVASTLVYAQVPYTIKETQHKGEVINIEKNSYKILEFSKRIKDITLNSNKNITVNYVQENSKGSFFRKIKIFAKDIGKAYALITFKDKSVTQINFNIVSDIRDIESIVKAISRDVTLTKINNTIVLKGVTKNNKEKNEIIEIVKKYDSTIEVVDIIKTKEPNLMVRMKLYIVEISNDDAKTIQHNWLFSTKNFIEVENADGYYNTTRQDYEGVSPYVNAQRNSGLHDALDGILTNNVSLVGGLTGAANFLGKYFNSGLALKYLQTEGLAKVLDESELLTLEGKESTFHAGGTVYVKVSTTTAEGVPTTELREIDYGLKLKVTVNEIINNEFIDLTITTNQDKIDWSNQVDGIPNFVKQSIDTYVVSRDQNTIILGGLVNKNDSKSISKVPLLGDIPVLGELFKSKSFTEGKSELAFFIVPEIVNPIVENAAQRVDKLKNFEVLSATEKNTKK